MNWYEKTERQHFAVLKDGDLFSLGDHGDSAAAEATANDQHLDWVMVIDGSTALNWRARIGWVTGIGGD
tara:strand:+ start:386 stop:592 length:207 start_codon:yes stop_codon:yes gene_type:complete